MQEWLARQTRLIGQRATGKLVSSRVAVIGLGGVGGAAFEALVRCGVGAILALDGDVFDETNLNRQILATRETVGRPKCEAAKSRATAINPECNVLAVQDRIGPEHLAGIFEFQPDFILDAIDSVSAKLALIEQAKKSGVRIVTSMGTGNRVSAEGFVIADIEQSAGNGCPLSRIMRRELRKRGIHGVPALFNKTPPRTIGDGERIPASISFVPPVAGYLLAGYVVRELIR